MTTKQIAEAVGKDERSVRRWVRKASDKMSAITDKMSASSSTHPADYTLDETCAIIEAGMGRNAAGIFRANADSEPKMTEAERLSLIVRETITGMVPALIAAIKGALPEKEVAALPAPAELSQRDSLRRVMNRAANESGDYSGVWRDLYESYYYRAHRNIRVCATNRGMKPLDYAEEEGLIPDLLSLAISMYGGAI